MELTVYIPIDVEDEIRQALETYMEERIYCLPLPKEPAIPSITVRAIGGTESETIDTWTVTLDSRAEHESVAFEQLRRAVGILKSVSKLGNTKIRSVRVNSLGNWGSDYMRPDISICSATLRLVAHEEKNVIRRG